ncbi:MAG: hypothetical protein ACREOS_10670 [Candidatus Dormibacteraceae bacterium]
MSISAPSRTTADGVRGRLEQTVELLERRGYALGAGRLAPVCLGGAVTLDQLYRAVAESEVLVIREGLVVSRRMVDSLAAVRARALSHPLLADAYRALTREFVHTLIGCCPYVLSVSIAGSLASGGFQASDDVDLNLIVEDGHRHLAYLALNLLGLVHALGYRSKPVDTHSARPLASRFMTANLLLERSQCFPLARQDPAMAYEFLASEPVYGIEFWRSVVGANAGLSEHFPQILERTELYDMTPGRRLPSWLFPAALDGAARRVGRLSWRYMQWTRRARPEALARVAYVRQTMRPYALFDDA